MKRPKYKLLNRLHCPPVSHAVALDDLITTNTHTVVYSNLIPQWLGELKALQLGKTHANRQNT